MFYFFTVCFLNHTCQSSGSELGLLLWFSGTIFGAGIQNELTMCKANIKLLYNFSVPKVSALKEIRGQRDGTGGKEPALDVVDAGLISSIA